jgi:hypothetical protein
MDVLIEARSGDASSGGVGSCNATLAMEARVRAGSIFASGTGFARATTGGVKLTVWIGRKFSLMAPGAMNTHRS